jgi:hypothetical protein
MKVVKRKYNREEVTYEEHDLYTNSIDPKCEHELDQKNWSGVRCIHCGAWFCY